jgi:hypothetical protein
MKNEGYNTISQLSLEIQLTKRKLESYYPVVN